MLAKPKLERFQSGWKRSRKIVADRLRSATPSGSLQVSAMRTQDACRTRADVLRGAQAVRNPKSFGRRLSDL